MNNSDMNSRLVHHRYQCDECLLQCTPSQLMCHSNYTANKHTQTTFSMAIHNGIFSGQTGTIHILLNSIPQSPQLPTLTSYIYPITDPTQTMLFHCYLC